MIFTFDPRKAASNLRKHGISFEEAQTAFTDPFATVVFDENHSDDEDRFILIGTSSQSRLLFVVYTDSAQTVRLIGARIATATERTHYEEGS